MLEKLIFIYIYIQFYINNYIYIYIFFFYMYECELKLYIDFMVHVSQPAIEDFAEGWVVEIVKLVYLTCIIYIYIYLVKL